MSQLWVIVGPGGQSVKLTMISDHQNPTNLGHTDETYVALYDGVVVDKNNFITRWTQYKPNTSATSHASDMLVYLSTHEHNYGSSNAILCALRSAQ